MSTRHFQHFRNMESPKYILYCQLIVLIICFSACCHSEKIKELSKTVFSSPNVGVTIHSIEGYGNYSEFAKAAAKELEAAVNSQDLKQMVLNYGQKIIMSLL